MCLTAQSLTKSWNSKFVLRSCLKIIAITTTTMWRMIGVDSNSQSLISTRIHMLTHPIQIHRYTHACALYTDTPHVHTCTHTLCKIHHSYTHAHKHHTNTHTKMCTREKKSISNFLPSSTFPQKRQNVNADGEELPNRKFAGVAFRAAPTDHHNPPGPRPTIGTCYFIARG